MVLAGRLAALAAALIVAHSVGLMHPVGLVVAGVRQDLMATLIPTAAVQVVAGVGVRLVGEEQLAPALHLLL
jgi:hypothetical protein